MGPMFQVMALGLIRDRGALALSFLLPPIIFVIFAAVFSGSSGGDLQIRIAIHDGVRSDATRAVTAALLQRPAFRPPLRGAKAGSVEAAVRAGDADAGLQIVAGADGTPLYRIRSAPNRRAAALLLQGHLRDILLVRQLGRPANLPIRLRAVAGTPGGDNNVSYYAGAVAVLFLLFAAIQGAVTLHEDRESGVIDRIVSGPTGIGALVDGKFAFIVVQGCLQVLVIFLVAWLAYDVRLPAHLLPWAVTTFCTAVAVAGLALLMATLCSSRRQALALGNFVALFLSAVGGSMVPRFLMPDWLQTAGWFTPNAWAIDAYTGSFWRGDGIATLAPAWGILAAMGLGAFLAARLAARRFEHI